MAINYKWAVCETDDIDWADILMYISNAKKQKEINEKLKIIEYMNLVRIIHTSQPKELIQDYYNILNDSVIDSEIGDIEKIEVLKSKQDSR